jgi:two-component system response regulator NreC
MVRSGLHHILAEEADIKVIGEAGTAEEAVELAGRTRPDVLVMDLSLPGVSGLVATGQVRRASPGTLVLVLTAHNEMVYLRRAFAAGASGYLLKEAADIDLVQAVRTVASGRQYVHPTLGAAACHLGAAADRLAGPGGQLSERELEVLRGIARGHTNAEIAAALQLSVRTIETHRTHIQQKLGARTRAELVKQSRSVHLLIDDKLL